MIRRRRPLPAARPGMVRQGYAFQFELEGLRIQAGGSGFTGREWVCLNGERISQGRNRSRCSQHDFTHEDRQYRIEFELLSPLRGTLVCRLYRDGQLRRLAAATPQHPPWSGPLFGAALITGLYLTDTGTLAVPLTCYLLAFLATLALDIGYASRHIRVVELEV
jgi:hypothetical protein